MCAGEDAAVSDQDVSQAGGAARLPVKVPAEVAPKAWAEYSGQDFFRDYPALPALPNRKTTAERSCLRALTLYSRNVLGRRSESNPPLVNAFPRKYANGRIFLPIASFKNKVKGDHS